MSPDENRTLWNSSSASMHETLVALEAAGRASSLWSTTKPPFRHDIFLKAANILDRRAGECKGYMVQEIGAHAHFAQFNLATAAEILRDVAGRISSALSGIVPVCQEQGTHALVVKGPYGVVLGIAPCVIYHRPEDAAGITTLLIEHPAVKQINFTGSTVVGSTIAETAGRNLKPVLMELGGGGKNNAIVCEDADLEKAAQQCALGAFLPSAGVNKVSNLISDALAKGATVVHGGIRGSGRSASRIPPTVIGGVTEQMIYHTESFGPSVSLISVSNDGEAIAAANDSEYGLSGAVFTRDLDKGLSIAARIETGAVRINGMSIHDEAELPHGGAKKSGWGWFNAQAGLDEFLRTKTITFQTEW
ncbi:hypothetical protein DL766_005662 [Monosporascus sp. MC13-8B]|nr:hypothetical protein DL766_005662 [Monosporascus sp. MC13-8B]